MIQPQELRIGNYVHVCNESNGVILPLTNIYSRIFTIEFNGARVANDNTKKFSEQKCFKYPYEYIEPIPLTEEILLKCGFEKSNDLDKFYHLDLLNEWTRIYFNPKHKVCTLSINQHDSRISIQYLHQLQNLIFSLTQKELTIQL